MPSLNLRKYVSKNFAIIDVCHQMITESALPERSAAEMALHHNDLPKTFLCPNHESQIWLINRIACNVYFNNERKHIKGSKRNDEVRSFKERQ